MAPFCRRFAIVGCLVVVGSLAATPATASSARSAPRGAGHLAVSGPIDLGPDTVVVDVNERGQVIGYRGSGGEPQSWFLWERGRFRVPPGPRGMALTDINNHGDLLGRVTTTDGRSRVVLVRSGRVVTVGGGSISAVAMNDRGMVTGYSRLPSGQIHAFVWYAGRMRDLGTLGGTWSAGSDINNAGQIAGNSAARNGRQHGFIYSNGRMRDLGHLGGDYAYVTEINERGHVLGLSLNTARTADSWFLWRNGRMIDTRIDEDRGATLTDRDLVVATHLDAGWQAMTWYRGVTRNLPRLAGDVMNFAVRGNNRGQIVGYGVYGSDPMAQRAELWSGGTVRALPAPGFGYVSAGRITDAGYIAGSGYDAGFVSHALLWRISRVPVERR